MPRPKPLIPTTPLGVRVTVPGLEWINETAEKHNMSRSELVRAILRKAKDDYDTRRWRP